MRSLQPAPRGERLAALHNPWSNTAVAADRWAFLNLCESREVVDLVTAVTGPDVILWDSQLYLCASEFIAFVQAGREGRYWPVDPQAGALVMISFGIPLLAMSAALSDLRSGLLAQPNPSEPLYVIRYFPASSRFLRDPRHPTNWVAMEEQVLLNYTTRALWLVSGEDRASNDFVTGFSGRAPSWKPQP